jgi:CheY-like chemotaxis protein
MRILVVEDTEDIRSMFRVMLESLGHDVVEATDGRHAIEVSVESKPDLILMDLRMPGVDGLLGTKALRAIHDFRTIPIIAVTAHYSQKTSAEALAAGCDDCISKPVSPEQLAEVLSRYQ